MKYVLYLLAVAALLVGIVWAILISAVATIGGEGPPTSQDPVGRRLGVVALGAGVSLVLFLLASRSGKLK